MKKDLPKIYSEGVIQDTNKVVAYTKSDEIEEVREEKKSFNIEKSVAEKVREIFNSVHYVYKMDVVIETDEGKQVKQLVGKNKNSIITMDNEQIPLSKIKDIYIQEKK